MFKAKILAVGPCEVGKTTLSNFLADASETTTGDYRPTQAVRIVEFEVPNVSTGGGRHANCEVELWDVSGDTKFENCWPAIARETNGVLLVCDPQHNSDKELEPWYEYFATQQRLKETQAMLFVHHKQSGDRKDDPQLSGNMRNIQIVHTCLEEDAEEVRSEFQKFLTVLMHSMSEKREQEELSIMNSRG